MLLTAAAEFLGTFEMFTGSLAIPQRGGVLRFSGPIILAVGLIGFVAMVRETRTPSGLTVNQEGVTGEGALVSTIHVPWSDLEIVELGTERNAKVVRLYDGHGELHVLKPILLGSDPIIIAETIEYFRAHPDARGQLDVPSAALALVGDFTRA